MPLLHLLLLLQPSQPPPPPRLNCQRASEKAKAKAKNTASPHATKPYWESRKSRNGRNPRNEKKILYLFPVNAFRISYSFSMARTKNVGDKHLRLKDGSIA